MTLSTSAPASSRLVSGRTADLCALACAGSAGVHGALVVPHAEESTPMAAAFVAAAVALAMAAAAVAMRPLGRHRPHMRIAASLTARGCRLPAPRPRSPSTTRCASSGRTTSPGPGWRSSPSPPARPASRPPQRGKPFYGEAAGGRLTALLQDHISIAVALLEAARSGDAAAFQKADTAWYANADDIADFLARANPRYWPRDTMRTAMKEHLDQTLAEATHELTGDYAKSVADYEEIHHHILEMADLLSAGIIRAFPARFH